MKKRYFLAWSATLLLGLNSAVLAATIDERVDRAHRRIDQGIRSGSLTREEAHRLKEEFSQVRRAERRARADGHLDRRERERLNYELDRLERHISRFKHNDEGRDGYPGDRRDGGRPGDYRRW